MQRAATGRKAIGHPVDVASGTMFNTWEDFRLPGRMDLVLMREYSTALIGVPGPMGGNGWTLNFFASLREENGDYVFFTPEGHEVYFEDAAAKVLSGEVVRNFGAYAEIQRDRDRLIVTRWNIENHDAERFVFRSAAGGQPMPLRSIEDVTGQGIDLQYDEKGRLSRAVQRRERRSLQFQYNEQGLVGAVNVLAPTGKSTRIVTFSYDEEGNLVAVRDVLGQVSRYAYDDHFMIREETRSGGIFTFQYDEQGRCIFTSGRNRYNQRTFRYLDAIGATRVTDSQGNEWNYTWLPTGQITRTISPLGLVSTTTYDEYSRIVEKVDPKGGTTAYAYDEAGNRCDITDPAGQTVRFEYNDLRQLTALIDTNGNTWKLQYDPAGNLVATEDPLGNHWKCWYNVHGEVLGMQDALGAVRKFAYNERGEVIREIDWNGNATSYEYDEFGRIVSIINPFGVETRYVRDIAGRVVRIDRPDGRSLFYEYNVIGDLSLFVDADGQRTVYRYGSCNRLIEKIDPLGRSTKFRWNSEPDQLAEMVNETGERYRFEYDADSRLILEEDFEGHQLEYGYDGNSNRTQITSAAGEVQLFEYDALNRLIRKQLPDGTEVRFEYDALGNVIRAKNDSCDVTFERDAAGRVIKETQNSYVVESRYDLIGNRIERKSNLGHQVTFGYDPNGWLKTLAFPEAGVLHFEHNVVGQEVLRKLPGETMLSQHFDLLGRLVEQRAERIGIPDSTRPEAAIPDAAQIVKRSYKYDAANNLVEMLDHQWGETRYSYDAAGQLVHVAQGRGMREAFRYDPAGNIVQALHQNGTVRGNGTRGAVDDFWNYGPGNILEQEGDVQFEYDADGRVIRKTEAMDTPLPHVWEYEWNGEGWLASVRRPDGAVWRYSYDAFGRRIRKEGPEEAVDFVWDGNLLLHEISTAEGKRDGPVSTWVFTPDGYDLIAKVQAGEVYFGVTDYLGTPRELIRKDGSVAWSAYLSAWGEVEELAVAETDCPFRFPGQWLDRESGLFYNRFRYYDPTIGRYYAPDPLGLSGSINPYQYVPSPTSWIDPFGLDRVVEKVGNREYIFDRDSRGRTVRAEGPLSNPNRLTYTHRDPSAQRRVSSGTGNHAGHLIGNQFGAPGGEINLVQMCPRLNLSGWKKMENELVRLTRNNRVRVVVTVHYDGDSTVPSKFTVDAEITDRNGNTTRRRWRHRNCT